MGEGAWNFFNQRCPFKVTLLTLAPPHTNTHKHISTYTHTHTHTQTTHTHAQTQISTQTTNTHTHTHIYQYTTFDTPRQTEEVISFLPLHHRNNTQVLSAFVPFFVQTRRGAYFLYFHCLTKANSWPYFNGFERRLRSQLEVFVASWRVEGRYRIQESCYAIWAEHMNT